MSLFDETIAAIAPPDATARAAARERLDRMTMPRGALGRVGELGVTLAGIAGDCPPPVPEPAAVAVFAGDHGVHAQGVTPWPQEVTAQMVANFLAGGAVVNAFARQIGADVLVVDVGVAAPLTRAAGARRPPGCRRHRGHDGRPRTDPRRRPSPPSRSASASRGSWSTAGNRALLTGDMGIANTTAAAALTCVFTGADPAVCDGPRHRHRRRHPRPQDRRRAAGAGAAPRRPGRPAGRARRVRRAWSTRRSPVSCSAGRRRACRCCSTASTRARPRWWRPPSRRTPSARASRATARSSPPIDARSPISVSSR